MQRFIHTFALAVTLTGTAAFAAEQPSHEQAPARIQQMADQLDLTAEQKTAITPVMRQQATELRTLRDNPALNRRHKIKRAREINEAASARIRASLTPEQQVKYDALRAEAKAQRRDQFRERMKARESGAPAAAN